MNRRLRKLIPAALILLVVGALIMVAAMFSMKFDFRRLGTRRNVTNTYTPAGDFEDILIGIDTAELTFLPSEDRYRLSVEPEEGEPAAGDTAKEHGAADNGTAEDTAVNGAAEDSANTDQTQGTEE